MEIRALKDELLQRKAEIEKLKQDHSWEEPARKRMCVTHKREVDNLQDYLQKEKDKNEDLKRQLIKALEKDADSRSELSQLKQQYDTEKHDLDQKLRLSQKECNELSSALEEHIQESRDTTAALESEIKRLHAEESLLRSSLERAEQKETFLLRQVKEQQTALSEAQQKNLKLEAANLRIRELTEQLEQHEETVKIAQIMRAELEELPRLRRENAELKEENELHRQTRLNVQLMKEQLHTAEHKVVQHEALQQQLGQQAVEIQQLKQTIAGWELLKHFSQDLRTPSQVKERITSLKQAQLLLSDQVGQLKAQNSTLELKLQTASRDVVKTKAELEKVKKSHDEQTVLLRRVQRRLLLAGKEREAYKSLLDSYQGETSINMSSATMKQIQSLEGIIENYRHTLEQAEKEITELRRGHGSAAHLRSSSAKNSEAQTDPVKFAGEEKGEAAFKIVHFRENPVEIASRQRLEAAKKLEEENELLRARIKILEKFGCCEDLTAKVQQNLQQGGELFEVKSLSEKLNAAETKNRRLLEAFKRTSKEFREVCYLLTGYRIDIPTQGKYRLSHMYAELPGDNLLFERVENELNLLETSYSTRLGPLIETYLHEHNSIPAFLGAITMELFGQQTCIQMEDALS